MLAQNFYVSPPALSQLAALAGVRLPRRVDGHESAAALTANLLIATLVESAAQRFARPRLVYLNGRVSARQSNAGSAASCDSAGGET